MIRNCFLFACVVLSAHFAFAQSPDKAIKSMKWRPIGPANMGGRVTDIEGIPGDPTTFYVAGADGGIFKTTNGGVTMQTLFTEEKSYSIGDITLAPSDPSV
ncbi:MAG: WD40/YVTN/BNR-like repeat-containing protein, partial [Cytophagales bacterium]